MVAPRSIQDNDKLLSPSEVAKQLGVHRSSVHNWMRDGMIKSEKHGNFHAIHIDELAKFSKFYEVDTKPKAKATKKKKGKTK